MNRFKCILTVISLAFICVPFYSFAQTKTDVENNRDISEPSTNNLQDFEKQYLIGIGDVLDIRIYNRPQLSRDTVRVDGRGMIRMPLLEREIRANCRTDSELAKEIADHYLEYLRNPHVEVFIKDFQSKPVAVIGAVRSPGRFQMQRQIRLLELISFAGGPTDLAGGRIQLKHDSSVKPCELKDTQQNKANNNDLSETDSTKDSDQNISWFDLKKMMLGEALDETENPVIRPGDIVHLIEADKIYVIGNVFSPTTVSLKEPVTLTQAIAIAGGTLPATDFGKVRISRQTVGENTKTELIVDLKAIKNKKADDIVLQANDIIEVPTSSGKKFIHSLINAVAPGIARLPMQIIP